MRVLSITAQKPTSTGSGVYLTEVVKCLSHLGHTQAIVYGRAYDDSSPDCEKEASVTYPVTFGESELDFDIAGMSDNMPYPSTRYCDFTDLMTHKFVNSYAVRIQKAILEFKPDLIICHHLYLTTAIASHINATLLKPAKIVAICHGTDIRQMNKHQLCADYIKKGIDSLDQIFVLHTNQIEDVKKTYGAQLSKVDVIGTGFNADVFNDNVATSDRCANSIVYAGKICYQKGVRELIFAASELAKETKGITLTLAGGHSNEKEYAEIVQIAKDSNVDVNFAGKLTQAELAKVYAKSKLFCLPSFFEGLPLVSLEALACGCSCVMTDLPGIREWYLKNTHGAPLIFVKPPKMTNVDVPLLSDLPQFRQNLKNALKQAFELESNAKSVSRLSWTELTKRLLDKVARL